jgi:nucleoside-diphosphate-sugar epimerase
VRVLVTGSAGFVGRHFARHLQDHDVLRVDVAERLSVDARDFFRGDNGHFDLVIHAAAHVGGRKDIEGRAAFVGAYNLQLDGAMFEWALRTRPNRVVYFSSSAVYPVKLQEGYARIALSEWDVNPTVPVLPDATYGWVKLTGERLAAEAEAEGLRLHVFRPFSGYGEDQSEDYPFPAFAARSRRKDDPFQIWGDGTQVRDWIHVDDVVGGVMTAIEQDVHGPMNLCTGRGVSFNALADMFTTEADYNPAPEHILDAPRGVSHRVGDPDKMLTVYQPKVTLEEGIRRALAT